MRVLAFGEVMMRLMAPDHKTLEQTHSFDALYTGTGVNILGGLHQLGVKTRLFTCLPDNRIGKAAAAQLRKLGISDEFIRFEHQHLGMYFLEKGFGQRSSYVTYMNRSMTSFAQHAYDGVDYDLLLDGVDCIHICGIALIQDHTYRIALQLAQKASRRGIKVAFDCNYRPSLWAEPDSSLERYYAMLQAADWVFATERDAARLLPNSTHLEGHELMQSFKNHYFIEGIYGTQRLENQTIRGIAYSQGKVFESSIYQLEVYDRIGGGDGFALGVIYGLLNAYPTQSMLEFAAASGVLAHTSYGDTPLVSKQDIENLVNHCFVDIVR